MKYTIVKPHYISQSMARRHFSRAFDRLTPEDKPKAFKNMLDKLQAGRAVWYHIQGKGVDLHLVTSVNGAGVFVIDAIAGKGMLIAAPDIIRRARSMGYPAMQYETRKKGMRKMLQRYGFVVAGTFEDGSTVHRKHLNG
ncbi:hypothetical protein ACOIV3_001884 [Vibrio vulnificus]